MTPASILLIPFAVHSRKSLPYVTRLQVYTLADAMNPVGKLSWYNQEKKDDQRRTNRNWTYFFPLWCRETDSNFTESIRLAT